MLKDDKVVFIHPTGNANVRAAVAGILNKGLLAEFHTSIAAFPDTFLDRLGGLGPFSMVRRRHFDPALKTFTVTHPWREAGRMISEKLGLSSLVKHESGSFCIDAVYQGIDKQVAKNSLTGQKKSVKAVYAYEDGALASFQKAKSLGLKCFYDLPIGYWRMANKLLEAEKETWPEWQSTLVGFLNSDAKLARKDEELRLADKIFVASSFTAKSLEAFPGKLAPIEIIPYGFPTVIGNRNYSVRKDKQPLKALFVGGLSQRKGLANLFDAVEQLQENVELTVVGMKMSGNCAALDAALAKHRWIPSLPHAEILALMRQHDVLIFPSLFEGFGLVITEAMSQGTPVITTDRTAGPDLINHGQNGWLVEAGSSLAIREALEELLLYPNKVIEVGKEAMKTALLRPWERYGQELAEAVGKTI